MNIDSLLQEEEAARVRPAVEGSRDLEAILGVVRKINTSLVLSEVLELVLDEAIRITNAERGFLMLADEAKRLRFAVGRNEEGESIQAESFQVSSSVLDDVFMTGESLCIENALNDERFERRQSILNLELQTIICSPLKTQDETIGVIYVDSKYIQDVDKADVLYLFEILAGQAAIAIKNARLFQDLKDAYEDLTQANEQIVKFERMAMKGEIAGEISHELKNMVSVVLLQLHLLGSKFERLRPDQVREMVGKALAGTERIQKFSMNLLTRSRANAKIVTSNPNELLQNFVDFVKVLPKYKRNAFSLTLADNMPDIPMDVDQIQQVLLNLVNNAVEAYAEATVVIRTEFDMDSKVVTFSIGDNGPGIDESILSKVLQEKITTKRNGHGYGLPICRQIVEHHGGTIRVESRRGLGTTFIMSFPLAAAH